MDNRTSDPISSPQDEWQDWTRGVQMVRARLEDYARKGMIRPDQLPALTAYYESVTQEAESLVASGAMRYEKTTLQSPALCWNCGAPRLPTGNFCPRCGRVQGDENVERIRYLNFLNKTAIRLHTAGLLELHQVHAIEADVTREIAWVKQQLEQNRLSGIELFRLRRQTAASALAVGITGMPPELQTIPEPAVQPSPQFSPASPSLTPPPPPVPRRNIMEVLLDPQSIQWLLASGGLLLFVGLIVYLASKGIFQDRVFMASLMGVGNIILLGIGWALLLKTRFHMAGRAITLLACLAMPLNLWFYHVQGMMTLDGHLWVPAALICLLYAASARVLKDPLFVYVMMGGITLTGLLILSDLDKFKEIAAPSMLLMVLGLIAIHLERVFVPDQTSPFSRKRFGLAFFFSGQALIAASLGLLLGAQIVGWLWLPFFHEAMVERPQIATDTSLKILALAIVCAAVYAWLYSTLVVRRKSIYAYLAAGAVLWAQVLVIDIWAVDVGAHVIILAMSLTALAAIAGQRILGDEHELGRSLRMLGMLLATVAVGLAMLCHVRATWDDIYKIWPYQIGWITVVAMLTAAIVSRIGAWTSLPKDPQTAATYFFWSGTALLLSIAATLSLSGLTAWHHQAPLLILVPLGYLIASKIYGDKPSARATFGVAQLAMIIVMFSVFVSAVRIAPTLVDPIAGSSMNLWLALIAIEAAIFYALLSAWYQRTYAIYIATAMVSAALWQVFGYFALPATTVINGYALLGLALLVVYRLAVLDDMKRQGLSYTAFVCGNGLLALAVVVSTLMTLADISGKRIGSPQLTLTSGLALMLIMAAMLTRNSAWRRFHVLAFAIETALAVICLQKQLNLTGWQNFEMFLLVAGVVTLISSHVALLRNRSAGSGDIASLGLPLGSLIICLPLAATMLYYRFFTNGLSLFDEITLITASVMLFVSGVMLKIRATTLIGGAFGILHLLILVVYAGMNSQLTLGIYLTIGGATIFAIGLILSLCRERLLSLPDRYRARDGIFRVLNWR